MSARHYYRISRRGEEGVWATLATRAAVDAATVARELGFEAGELELEEIDMTSFACLTCGILAGFLARLAPSSAAEARAGEERARAALRAMQAEHASRRMAARARGETWKAMHESLLVAGELRHERARLRALARRLERVERASGGTS